MEVVFPGSFDPVTNGHLNIIERCINMFEHLHIVIANNSHKQALFTSEERYDFLATLLNDNPKISIYIWNKLMVNFLVEKNINIIVRGVRSSSDYEYEFALAQINKGLGKGTETIFLPTDEKYLALRSSVIKDIVRLGGDVSDKVPSVVLNALKQKVIL